MCTNFAATHNEAWVRKQLGPITAWPQTPYPKETYPGQPAPIARLATQGSADSTTSCTLARFGLVPHWCKDSAAANQISRKTYNARIETVADKPSYRTPWRKRQLAIALIDHFYEPNWETGQAVRWRIQRADGQPMGVAGLWDQWTDASTGEIVTSFTMLTVNADGHPVMGRFHRPEDEKRSIVVLEPNTFHDWLHADTEQACDFMRVPSAGALAAEPAPLVKVQAGVERNLTLF